MDKLTKDVNKLETKLEGAERELSFARGQLDLKSSQLNPTAYQKFIEILEGYIVSWKSF